MSDRIAVFNEGRIAQVGTPAEIYEHPSPGSSPASWGPPPSSTRAARRRLIGREGNFALRPEQITLRPPRPGSGRRRHDRRGHHRRGGSTSAPPPAILSTSRTARRSPSSEPNTEAGGRDGPRRAACERVLVSIRPGDVVALETDPTRPLPEGVPPSAERRDPGPSDRDRRRRAAGRRAAVALIRHGRALRRAGDHRQRRSSTSWTSSAPARARSRSWPGPGTPRTAATTRGRLGHPVREGDRLPGHGQDVRHLRRGGHPDEDRRLRRGLRLRRRLAAADRLRRRRPGEHLPGAELRRRPGFLKDKAWNSVDGADVRRPARLGRQPADVPHRRGEPGADLVGGGLHPTPASTAGKVTAYDSPIYIADAALFLMKTKPDLGIKNPYALDDKQLAAAVELLKAQSANVSEYWSDYLKEVQSFKSGNSVIGTTWQVIVNTRSPRRPRSRRCCPTRARPAGRTPGCSPRKASTRTARTSG